MAIEQISQHCSDWRNANDLCLRINKIFQNQNGEHGGSIYLESLSPAQKPKEPADQCKLARQGPVQVGEKSDCKTKSTDELKVKSSPFHTLESLSLAREPKLGSWQASVRWRDKVQSKLGSLAVASPAPQSLEASRAGEQGFEARSTARSSSAHTPNPTTTYCLLPPKIM